MKSAVLCKEDIYAPIRYIINAGGKRLRPVITLLSCEAVGGDYRQALSAAVAIEMLHTFTLIHDDIMDNSRHRRGLMTIHEKWDTATAILSGDLLAGISFRTLLTTKSSKKTEAAEVFTKSYIDVCEGQHLDMNYAFRSDVALKHYFKMIEKKTAALIATAAQIGGIMGNGNSKMCNSLKMFGFYLGIAFQIHDDLLDITGSSKSLGKPVGQDILECKKTYLLLKAVEIADKKDRPLLFKVLKQKHIENAEVRQIKKIYRRLGIVDCAKEEIAIHIEKAKKELNQLPQSDTLGMLQWIADKNLARDN